MKTYDICLVSSYLYACLYERKDKEKKHFTYWVHTKMSRLPFWLSGGKRRHVRRCFTYCLTVCFHNKSVMVLEGISSLENANIFFPKSFSEAPI